jgi:predicted PolB exonuclease-like 3'-5' exonuclease
MEDRTEEIVKKLFETLDKRSDLLDNIISSFHKENVNLLYENKHLKAKITQLCFLLGMCLVGLIMSTILIINK